LHRGGKIALKNTLLYQVLRVVSGTFASPETKAKNIEKSRP
jgi:hypothetical protein